MLSEALLFGEKLSKPENSETAPNLLATRKLTEPTQCKQNGSESSSFGPFQVKTFSSKKKKKRKKRQALTLQMRAPGSWGVFSSKF